MRIFNIAKALLDNFSPYELQQMDYTKDEIKEALRIISYSQTCFKKNRRVTV